MQRWSEAVRNYEKDFEDKLEAARVKRREEGIIMKAEANVEYNARQDQNAKTASAASQSQPVEEAARACGNQVSRIINNKKQQTEIDCSVAGAAPGVLKSKSGVDFSELKEKFNKKLKKTAISEEREPTVYKNWDKITTEGQEPGIDTKDLDLLFNQTYEKDGCPCCLKMCGSQKRLKGTLHKLDGINNKLQMKSNGIKFNIEVIPLLFICSLLLIPSNLCSVPFSLFWLPHIFKQHGQPSFSYVWLNSKSKSFVSIPGSCPSVVILSQFLYTVGSRSSDIAVFFSFLLNFSFNSEKSTPDLLFKTPGAAPATEQSISVCCFLLLIILLT
jgi:hypothetical protein